MSGTVRESRDDAPKKSRNGAKAIAVVVALVVPLATLLLYARGASLTPPGKAFTWMHALNTGDPYTYLAWVEQAREGRAAFRVLFTEESSRALLIHPLFFAIGIAARVTGLPPIAVYHAARVLLGAALLLALFRFFARRLASPGPALFALLYVALGSGLGWIFVRPDAPAMSLPVDLWMPEAIVFLSILESPLFLAALLLALLIYERLFFGTAERRWPADLVLFGLTVLLGFTHPFEVVSIGATLIVASVAIRALGFRSPPGFARRIAAFALGAAIPLAYIRVVLRADPVFAHWLGTVQSPSPPPACFLLAFAPQIALALLALPRAFARRSARDLLAIAWPVATALLLYAPLAQPRRFVAGVQIPLTLLAAEGLFAGATRLPAFLRGTRARAVLVALFLAASFGTNAIVVGADLAYFARGEYPLYLERELLGAFAAFRARSAEDALLLASPAAGHFVPALTGRRVVAGHYDMTVDPARKAEELRRFYDPRTPAAERRALLARTRATHVLLSPYEASTAGTDAAALTGPDPLAPLGPEAGSLGLAPVFRAGPVTLFEVSGAAGRGEEGSAF